jgi:hypothetical protein
LDFRLIQPDGAVVDKRAGSAGEMGDRNRPPTTSGGFEDVLARRFRLPAGALAAGATLAAAFGAAAPAAHAGLLTQTAAGCPTETLSQPFLAWGDPSEYFLAPGGDFSAGAGGWSLSGGAQTGTAGGSPSGYALSLPDGSSATSPAVCVGVSAPSVRFFATNSGNPLASLAVSVNFVGPLGLPLSLPIGTVSSSGSWQPTPIYPILANLLPLLPGNQTPVSFAFTPAGSGGNWQIDDLYVDPIRWGG